MLPTDSVGAVKPYIPPPPPPKAVEVASRQGDTLTSVAKTYGVSNAQIAKANPSLGQPDHPLPVGTKVSIPVGKEPGEAKTYATQPGDSVAGIAKRQHVDEKALREANDLGPGQEVYPGRQLLLPAADKADPASPQGLREAFPGLAKFPDDKLKSISDAAKQLQNGTPQEKLSAALTMAKEVPPENMPELLKKFGADDKAIAKLATDKDALGAMQKLADPKSSTTDKISAGLTLANSVGGLASGRLGEVLKPYLAALPAGAKLADAIGKYTDPNASALDKAKATLALANAVKTSAGTAFPQLSQVLRNTESFSKTIGAALTLIDPSASVQDKAKAALDLAANVPDLAGDASKIGAFLKSGGVSDSAQIQQAIDRLPIASRLPESIKQNLDPDVAKSLTPAQAEQLSQLAANGELKDGLTGTLKELKDPKALSNLLSSLDQAGGTAGQKALLNTLSGLKSGVADQLLTSTIDGKNGAQALAKLSSELGLEGRAGLAKLVKDFDADSLKVLLKVTDKADVAVTEKAIEALGKADSKVVGAALKGLDKLLSKAGVELTSDIATKLVSGVAKAIPVVGAAPAVYSAYELGKTAADTSLPPAIRFLALEGAKLNGGHAALDIAQPFIDEFGIPIAADVGATVAELGIQLVVDDQTAKYKANPSGYKTPDWLNTLNVAMAGAEGPTGVASMVAIYGPRGTVQAAGAAARDTGKLAIYAAKAQSELDATLTRDGMHLTAQGLHGMADMVRHPEKYGVAAKALGEQAVKQLSDAVQAGGDLAKAAGKELVSLVGDLKAMGEKGVQALGWIASHPGEAAEKAAVVLTDVAKNGIKLGTEAGKAVAKAALDALGDARDALQKAGQAASAAYQAADRAVKSVVNSALALGKQGIQTLGWIANHPGQAAQIAQQTLVDVASKAGALAKDAYDQVVNLGEKGVALTKAIVSNLKDAGEEGARLLRYAVEHPGQAADEVRKLALDGLKSIANGVGAAATAAAREVADLVNEGVSQAKETAKTLLLDGGQAAKEIAEVWSKDLSEGASEVIGGLKDLGGALGDRAKQALGVLSNAGIDAATAALNALESAGGWVYGHTLGAL